MSKRNWQHPEVPAGETTVSWRSAGQLEDTPAFREWLDREFPQGAAELEGEGEMETSRRSFLKLMGASTALAGFGMAACRRPETYIVPYTKAPEWVIPGKATYYASAMPRANGTSAGAGGAAKRAAPLGRRFHHITTDVIETVSSIRQNPMFSTAFHRPISPICKGTPTAIALPARL